MALDDAQIAILATHLATDPEGRGYSTMTDVEAADSLNLIRAANTVNREWTTHQAVTEMIAPSEWTVVDHALLDFLFATKSGSAHTGNANVRALFHEAIPVPQASATRAAFDTHVGKDSSDAEILLGDGVEIRHRDVAAARGRT